MPHSRSARGRHFNLRERCAIATVSPHRPAFIERLMLMTGAAALAATALLYPLKLPDSVYGRLGRWFGDRGALDFFYAQIEPIILFGMSPLLIKEAAANAALLLLLALYCLWKIAAPPRLAAVRPQVHWLLWAFLIWSAASLLWSPTFVFSLRMFYTLALFAFGFVILSDVIARRADWMRFIWLIMGVSAALTLISFLQHMDLTSAFMLDWEQVRLRNRIGSFIGHNTGLSAFIMPSLFLGIALLQTARTRARRALMAAYLALLAFVIVAGQSRGVWLTLAIFLPLYFVALRWRLRWPLPWRAAALAAAIVAVVTLAQIAPFSWNPFFNRAAPIKKRLDYLLPETMLTETRLRIFVCSLPLIAQRPLHGHGLGTFRYIYPKAQGDYISSHPETRIVPTNLRTIRAHNDWLQIAMELGLVGLALAVGGVWLYARDGWRRLRRARPGDENWTALQIAVFVALMAQLFHALLDFPFHIPPTAMLAGVMGALWISGTRLALQPGASEDEHKDDKDTRDSNDDSGRNSNNTNNTAESSNPKSLDPKSEIRNPKLIRPRKVFALVLILVLIMPLPIRVTSKDTTRLSWKFAAVELARFTVLPIVTDYHQSRAQRHLNSTERPGLTAEDKWGMLATGFAHILKAQRLEFLNGEIRFDVANFRHQRALLLMDQGRRLVDEGKANEGGAVLDQARQMFANSITDVNESIEMGFRFHTSYHLRALNWSYLEQLSPGQGFRERAKEDYYTAIHYTPAFGPALQDLSELLIQEPRVNAAEVYRLRGMIARYDQQWFKANYIMKAYVDLYEKKYDDAVLKLRDLLKAAPEFTELYPALANTYLHMGRAGEALTVLETARTRGVESLELDKAWALYSILIGRNEEGLRLLRALESRLKNPDPGIMVPEWVALRRLGRMDELRTDKERVRAQVPDYDAYLTLEGTLLYETFKDREAGVALWREAITSMPRPQSHAYAHLVQHYERAGNLDEARRLLREGLGHHPDDPILLRLKARLLADDAAPAGTSATQPAIEIPSEAPGDAAQP